MLQPHGDHANAGRAPTEAPVAAAALQPGHAPRVGAARGRVPSHLRARAAQEGRRCISAQGAAQPPAIPHHPVRTAAHGQGLRSTDHPGHQRGRMLLPISRSGWGSATCGTTLRCRLPFGVACSHGSLNSGSWRVASRCLSAQTGCCTRRRVWRTRPRMQNAPCDSSWLQCTERLNVIRNAGLCPATWLSCRPNHPRPSTTTTTRRVPPASRRAM